MLRVAVLVSIGAKIDPGLTGGVVLADPVGGAVTQRREEAAAREGKSVSELAREALEQYLAS